MLIQTTANTNIIDTFRTEFIGIDFVVCKNKPITIINSAFPEYALEGYALDVIDYLMKPVSFERFVKKKNL